MYHKNEALKIGFMGFILIGFSLYLSGCGANNGGWLFQGDTGNTGPQGSPGATGNTGPQGAPGGDCSVASVPVSDAAPNGGSLITCPTSQSLVLNGTDGSNGAAGTPGTLVTPVQFCPGTPTYPSKFVENGFCLGGNLYAVYSQNGGFMALIPPGSYSSDGINSSCNFTVAANCVVSH